MEKILCPSCFRELRSTKCPHCGGAQNKEHQLPVGTLLRGRYRIGRVLGQGGFGITYLAWDEAARGPVAVKEFFPLGTVYRRDDGTSRVECITRDMDARYGSTKERFLREAGALANFRDIPVIVDILDYLEENNTAYIVMEYVKGVDLAKYIAMKGGRLSAQETFRILKPVMEALAKVHRGGIVHRDISPDNIILDPMGGAKLLDFGAVRAVENPDVDKGLNKSTEAILKHGFAPLEQYNTRGSLGPWTDEYAMCATVWYCLTGTVPAEASIRITEGIDPDWSSIPGLPEHQRRALHKGISCRAKNRYESMDALLEALFPEEEEPISVPQQPEPVALPPQPKPVKKSRKQRKLLPVIIGGAAVIALCVLIPLLAGKKEEPKPEPVTQVSQAPAAPEGAKPTEAPATVPTTPPTAAPTLSPEEQEYLRAEQLLAEGKLGEAAIAFGKLGDYSDARQRSFEIWAKITQRDTVGAGNLHTVGVTADGTVVAVGRNDDGRCGVEGWTDIVAVSAGHQHTVGLKADGTVVAVGNNDEGQCGVEGWTDIVAVSAGGYHTVGLKADGTVVAAGMNGFGQCGVEGWTDIVAVSAGCLHTVGLKADGTVVAVGDNGSGRCGVEGWTHIVAVSAGGYHTVGLKADGTVVAVGRNDYGRCGVEGWTDIVAVSAGDWHTVGLMADGTVVAVGSNYNWDESIFCGQCEVEGWTDIVAVSAGNEHTVGLMADGTVVAVGRNIEGQCGVEGWTDILLPKERLPLR